MHDPKKTIDFDFFLKTKKDKTWTFSSCRLSPSILLLRRASFTIPTISSPRPLQQTKVKRKLIEVDETTSKAYQFPPCKILQTPPHFRSYVKVDTWMGDQLTQSIHFLMANCHHHWCPARVVLLVHGALLLVQQPARQLQMT